MTPLPIDSSLNEIVAKLRDSGALVLVAEPGAGKTTRVPPAILRAAMLDQANPNIVMLQPRRVAARAAAQRIAEENGWRLGREVGYHVRFERKISRDTRLRVLTEGILTRQLIDDPFLEGVGCVILDEFHERSIFTDLASALLREIRQTVRSDLRIVVMSATLDAEPVAKWLGDCPVVNVKGRTFPVDIEYARSVGGADVEDQIVGAVNRVIAEEHGDVLVFLPGAEEIRRTIERLQPAARQHDLLVLPLYGSLPFEQQIRALQPTKQRRVIVATNIAETSLTIDGVRCVVDSGLARIATFDAERGLDRLEVRRISKASATQRAGRAGRTAAGKCIRLWTEKQQHELSDFELPEIQRVDLAGTILALHAWGKPDPRQFAWFEPPAEETIVAAERLLAMLGALTSETNGQITEIGRQMLSLPVHPRLARLLIAAAQSGLVEEGVTMAALLSEKDILLHEKHTRGPSDLLLRMELLKSNDRDLDSVAVKQVVRARDELRRLVQPSKTATQASPLRLVLVAYPDRVCKRRGNDPKSAVMVGGGEVRLARESIVHDAEFFVALDARHDSRNVKSESLVRIASAIEPQWLSELFPQSVRQRRTIVFDESRQRVVSRGGLYYRDLAIREDDDGPLDAQQAAKVLAEALRPRARELFEQNEEASDVLARVDLLRLHMPEHPWPTFDDAMLEEALAEACAGRRSVDDVKSAPLASLLLARLVYPLDRLLEANAPQALAVPTGNRIKVQYAIGQSPVLAVRLQELFGMTDTPRVANGRAAVTLHLLSPGYKPVQITSDLKNFWATTYFQVRKDLRVRYPKHSWPDDPLTATPQAKGKRRSQ